MIAIETRWNWIHYTGTREELITAGHAEPGQFPEGRKRSAYGEDWSINKNPKGLFTLVKPKPEKHLSPLESKIDRILQSVFGSAQHEEFKPLSESEKRALSEDELLQYELREIIGDSLYEWNYRKFSMVELKNHHFMMPAANDIEG